MTSVLALAALAFGCQTGDEVGEGVGVILLAETVVLFGLGLGVAVFVVALVVVFADGEVELGAGFVERRCVRVRVLVGESGCVARLRVTGGEVGLRSAVSRSGRSGGVFEGGVGVRGEILGWTGVGAGARQGGSNVNGRHADVGSHQEVA